LNIERSEPDGFGYIRSARRELKRHRRIGRADDVKPAKTDRRDFLNTGRGRDG
jgi:hypothetical protein